jgi:DNA-binding cell septation regulator SpoVG
MSLFEDNAVVIEEFRERKSGALVGFVRVRLASGLILEDCGIFRGDDGCWVSMPAKPMIDAAGAVVRDEAGKIKRLAMVNFTTRSRRDALTRQILAALARRFPRALD